MWVKGNVGRWHFIPGYDAWVDEPRQVACRMLVLIYQRELVTPQRAGAKGVCLSCFEKWLAEHISIRQAVPDLVNLPIQRR